MNNLSLKGSILVILAGVLWGTTGTSQGLAPVGVSSSVIGSMRLIIAGVFFSILLFLRKDYPKVNLSKGDLVILLVGTLSVVFYQLSFFYGVRISGVAVGTVIGIGSSPLWGGLLGYLFLGEKPAKVWYLSTSLAILGLIFLSFIDISSFQINFTGGFLMLIAGFTYAVYSLCAKKLMKKFHANFVMAVYFMVGGILMIPILFMNDMSWLFSLRGSILMIHLGIFATFLAYILFSRGLMLVPVSKATTLSLSEPLTASILGITVLGERVTMMNMIGIFLIFTSLLLLSRKS